MNPYPEPKSVIIMDNARIHHDADLIDLIRALGCRIEFIPPYSPDFNPIEEAFSAVKGWLRRNYEYIEQMDDPVHALMVACAQIDRGMTEGYYRHSWYMS
jgi:transposase